MLSRDYSYNKCKCSVTGTMEVSQKTDIQANLGTRYRCISTDQVNMKNVNVTLSNVTLEAYLVNNTLSVNGKYFL